MTTSTASLRRPAALVALAQAKGIPISTLARAAGVGSATLYANARVTPTEYAALERVIAEAKR